MKTRLSQRSTASLPKNQFSALEGHSLTINFPVQKTSENSDPSVAAPSLDLPVRHAHEECQDQVSEVHGNSQLSRRILLRKLGQIVPLSAKFSALQTQTALVPAVDHVQPT